MAGVSGGAKGLINVDLISRFVLQVKNEKNINILGGMQEFERIHIADVISALVAVINSTQTNWKPAYNLGSNCTVNLLELAEKIIQHGKQYFPELKTKLILEKKVIDQKFGMDSSSFFDDFCENRPKSRF